MALVAPAAAPIVPGPPVPAEYTLAWQAPPQCPEAQWLHARVLELLQSPAGESGVMDVSASIVARDGSFALELTTSYLGQEDRRVLEAGSCSDLAEAVAVVIAIALEPALELEVPPSLALLPPPKLAPPPTLEPAPKLEPAAPSPPPAASPREPRAPRIEGVLRIDTGIEYGGLPSPTLPIRVAFGVLWPRVRLEAAATYLVPRRVDHASSFDALYQLGSASVRGCARARIAATELPVCLGVEAGGLRVDTRGLAPPQSVTNPWFGPQLGAGVARRWRRIGIWVAGEVVIRAVGAELYLDDILVFRSPAASLRLVTGVEFFLS